MHMDEIGNNPDRGYEWIMQLNDKSSSITMRWNELSKVSALLICVELLELLNKACKASCFINIILPNPLKISLSHPLFKVITSQV